jgi:hypothetical protein
VVRAPGIDNRRRNFRECGQGALNVGYEPEGADLNITYPRDRTSSAKLLALMRHLRLAFGSPPYWEMARGDEQR